MKISERCKKQIENIEKLANEYKVLGEREPHNVVMWDRDFESIIELYLAYKDAISEKIAIKSDFEESEDRCAALEAENNELKEQIKSLKEENRKLYEKVGELHTIKKSFEVLRALYLGDYENDNEPF